MAQKEQGKEEARGEANVKKNFDKYLLFSNIRELLKNSDVKIGEIEKQAGCYPGYMSRLDKKDNTTEPSVEFVMTAAKLLNTSMDLMTSCNLTDLNPTDRYLAEFFTKLNTDTLADKLDWGIHQADELNELRNVENGNTTHPLFEYEYYTEENKDGQKEEVYRVLFKSKNFGMQTFVTANCYELRMKNFSTLYLMNVGKKAYRSFTIEEYAKEIWMYNDEVGREFLASNKDSSGLDSIVDLLFQTVMDRLRRPKIKKEFRSIIDAYFNDDLGENDLAETYVADPDEIPF